MWVADIQDECILGLDFLERHGCVVDLVDSTLHCDGEEIALQKPISATPPRTYRAVLDVTVSLPPRSECVTSARVDGAQSAGTPWALVQPAADRQASSSLNGLLVGRTLVDLRRSTVAVRLLNLTGQRRTLKKGTDIARCDLVQSVQLPSKSCRMHQESVELPAHLRSLYESSTTDLSPDQCHCVYSLICRFSHLFSAGPHDLGRTDVVKHTIYRHSRGSTHSTTPTPSTLGQKARGTEGCS